MGRVAITDREIVYLKRVCLHAGQQVVAIWKRPTGFTSSERQTVPRHQGHNL